MVEMLNRFTRIVILIPNAYEVFYVANFEKGCASSKWYRAESSKDHEAHRLAQLNVMGITNTGIDIFHNIHYLKKKTSKEPWFNFAYDAVRNNLEELFTSDPKIRLSVNFVVVEVKDDTTMHVNVSLKFKKLDRDSGHCSILKTYHGKSTRPLTRTRRPKNEKETMEKEAKKAALMEFFKEHFGFYDFNDLCVDELHRPINI